MGWCAAADHGKCLDQRRVVSHGKTSGGLSREIDLHRHQEVLP
jgi:hypothetical protein